MGKIAFLFPGQGAQTVGMGRTVAEEGGLCGELFHSADKVVGFPLTDLMFNGPEEQLTLTENTQPALVTTALATYLMVTEKTEVRPDFVAGHSLGEYAAISVAGGFSAQEAIGLVRLRGKAMREAVPPGEGSMAAMLNMEAELVEAVCRDAAAETSGVCVPANYNTSAQIVISGHKRSVDRALVLAKERGGKRCVPLAVSAPFHCPLMAPAADKMAAALNKIEIADLSIPLIANISAQENSQGEVVRRQLVEQVTGAVRWEASIQRLLALGVDTFIELGTGKVLTGMMKRIDRKARAIAVNGPEDLEKIASL
ncbi:MAG: ACP S-malonyltransferase [Magnetococcales bacterium]|nr:ACP S-malonyltransferase [Magnetococcales bacterium]